MRVACLFLFTSTAAETVFVLEGSGWSWQGDKKHPISAGDCFVYVADTDAHSLETGDDGLKALVFGTRERSDVSYLPRTGLGHVGRFWFERGVGLIARLEPLDYDDGEPAD